ncbi:Hypothetical protein I596_3712 [Dokdonella koreensis DS-123]|uniref:Uncharacterized protein n=1 Tax=Dokdonella koreensis DS-123 TaxID=1300342 RepID=A0A160DY42_9GAMM|nr:Hypothetical protein I596_3712 [Dokdonella koreensis DS-123]
MQRVPCNHPIRCRVHKCFPKRTTVEQPATMRDAEANGCVNSGPVEYGSA